MKRTGHAEDLYTLRLSITRQREFQACAADIVPVGKDAGGRCCVAVGPGPLAAIDKNAAAHDRAVTTRVAAGF